MHRQLIAAIAFALMAWGVTPAPAQTGADLSAAMTDAPDPVRRGNLVTYAITAHNAGPEAATGVSMFISFSGDGQTLDSMSGVNQADCTITYTGTSTFKPLASITCPLPDLSAGMSHEMAVVTKALTAGTNTNTATVSAGSPSDPNPANDSATATTTVRK